MARLPKLQWIPMILQAYNEARAKSGLKPVSPDELLNSMMKQSAPSRSTASPSSSTPNPGKVLPAHVRATKAKRNSRVRQPKNPGSEFYSVVRELRKTRQKLAHVETLQAQLQQLQTTMEQQLSELNKKIVETSGSASGSSSVGSSTPASETLSSSSESLNQNPTPPNAPSSSQFGGI